MPLRTGQVLQRRYRTVSLLGQGGMGAVYRAWDTRLNVAAALKEMIPQPGLDASTLEQLRRQFQQEAHILARLGHPHLVRVTDFFDEGGKAYLVMDFVEGESLAGRIKRQGALPEKTVLNWAIQLLDALDYCHCRGIIHRDVKPQNVIIRPDGRAILVDFGLVKLWDPHDPRTHTAMRGMGTPEYAPPEQYDTKVSHTDGRSDIYGLGATMYHALVGQAPPTATQRIARRSSFQPPRILDPRISPVAERIVLQAMALVVDERFRSAAEMRAALVSAGTAPGRVAPPRRPPKPVSKKRRTVAPSQRKLLPVWILVLGGFAVLALIVVVIGIVGLVWLTGRGQSMSVALSATSTPTSTPTPIPTPTATPPPLVGRIIFVSDRDSREDIAVVPADGSRAPMTLSDSGLDYAPSWSPNADEIVFVSKRTGKAAIYTMGASGGQLQLRIDPDPGMDRPLLAPMGDRVAFQTSRGVGWGVVASGEIMVADTEWVSGFDWSPDGKRIATINADTSETGPATVTVQVIDTEFGGVAPSTILEHAGNWKSQNVAWSPDGEWITFPLAPDDPYTELGIYQVRVDGSGLRPLVDVDGADDAAPVWSPDGSQLLFVSTPDNREDGSINTCDRSVIYSVAADGSDLRQLTDDDVESYDPAWSPDGRHIAYVVFEVGRNEVYVMDADGGNKVRLTLPGETADKHHPSWSPDGTQVVFASSRYAPRLYLLHPASAVIRQVASDSAFVIHSQVHATTDGGHLAFTREHEFSSREKRILGGNGGVCSGEGLVVISGLEQALGTTIGNSDDLLFTRRVYGWSSDGRNLLYQGWAGGGGRLWDTEAEAYTELENIPDQAAGYLTLSPGGDQVAYYDPTDDQVYLASVDGGAASNLSGGVTTHGEWGVVFSPDGMTVLFPVEDGLQVRGLDGALLHHLRPDLYRSYVGVGISSELNQAGEIELTPIAGGPASQAGILAGDVLVAVDGTQHTLGSDMAGMLDRIGGAAGTDVTLTIRREGVDEELTFVVTRELVRLETPTGSVKASAWLPGGSEIAYAVEFSEADETALWVHDLLQDEATRVATVSGRVLRLSASPDGWWLAFEARFEGNTEVYAVPTDGGAVSSLTNNPAHDFNSVWLP